MPAMVSSAAMVRLKADAPYGNGPESGTGRPALAGPTAVNDVAIVSARIAHTSVFFDRDLGGDVGAAVIRVVEGVAEIELPRGHGHAKRELERARQPDVLVLRERLRHRHRRLHLVEME